MLYMQNHHALTRLRYLFKKSDRIILGALLLYHIALGQSPKGTLLLVLFSNSQAVCTCHEAEVNRSIIPCCLPLELNFITVCGILQ